ncbi:MAG: hypothetical protein RRB13_04270 [bacterium]|nr:hypothetical protein [bacterium]
MTRPIALLLLALAVFAPGAFAQMVTPSLDPSEPLVLPAAGSWRYLKGENEQDDNRTATVAAGTLQGSWAESDDSSKREISANRGLLVAQAENVNIEAQSTGSEKIKYTNIDALGVSSTYETVGSTSQFSFAYLLKQLSLGGSYRSSSTQRSSYDDQKETGLGLSATYQLGRVFFAGFGVEQVSQPESYRPAVDWNVTSYGFALMAGKPDETLLRLEYANQRSLRAAAEGTYYNNVHQESVLTQLTAEIKMTNLLLSARTETTSRLEWSEYNLSSGELKTSRVGLGWVPSNGWIISGYQTSYTETAGTTERQGNLTEVAVGYNF